MVLSLPVRTLFAATLRRTCAGLLASLLACCLSAKVCQAETVLLDFSSPTCGPCQEMRPVVQRLISDGLPVREIDITREPQLAARFGVTRVPTFLVVVDGNPVDRVVGSTTYQQLHRMMRRAMPAPAPRQRSLPIGQSPARSTLPSDHNSRPTTPVTGSPNSLHERLLAATVKITVEDLQGTSAGTGTVVDARGGEALILTCGHLFRSSDGKGAIKVTMFQVSGAGAVAAAQTSGQLIDFDLDRDLALVSIRPTTPVPAVSIAGISGSPLAPQVAVTSVGCDHGQNPTAIDSLVTAVNRYAGTPNVEVAGAPVEGRSGGGLFNAQGQLVGVCYAADPQDNEGLYAALPAVYAKLDSLNLTMIYSGDATTPEFAPTGLVNTPSPIVAAQLPMSVRGQEPDAPSFSTSPAQTHSVVAALPPAEQAALEEIQRRGTNSEVICIIRPQDPTAKSQVITLNNVSPAFVRALSAPAAAAADPFLR